jgi:hypothetical protein
LYCGKELLYTIVYPYGEGRKKPSQNQDSMHRFKRKISWPHLNLSDKYGLWRLEFLLLTPSFGVQYSYISFQIGYLRGSVNITTDHLQRGVVPKREPGRYTTH